jgi:transcriptional regulator with XRE-family HTH domain
MAREKLNTEITREWVLAQAKLESDSDVTSVGGLAHRLGLLRGVNGTAQGRPPADVTPPPFVDPGRQSLGKFIELSRRRLRLTVEQLAERADVDLGELLAIEKAEDVPAETRTIYRLADVLGMRVDPLLELAGLVDKRSVGLTQSAFRFAARSEPMAALTREEEEALNWFVGELTKA